MRRHVVGWVIALAICGVAKPVSAGGYRILERDGVTYVTGVEASSGSFTTGRRPQAYDAIMLDAASRHGVDARLVEAVIRAESGFDRLAESPKGAVGLMQLMPHTAAGLGVRDRTDAPSNIDGGVRHLRYLLDRYAGDIPLALAAYNAGQGAVDSYRGIPPYPETQQYVKRVLRWAGVPESSSPALYRRYDRDGTVTFSNLPPRRSAATTR